MNKTDIFTYLKDNGQLEYGSTFTGDQIRGLLGIVIPKMATKATYDEITLQELGIIDHIRNKLLNEGKYLSQKNGDYSVLLPSQNEKIVLNYMAQATRKLNRGLKLNKNTPVAVSTVSSHDEARMHMKADTIKNEVNRISKKSDTYNNKKSK